MITLLHAKTGLILVENLLVRTSFCGKLKGLLTYRNLEPGSGMLFVSARQVHTFGMRFPVDLYFLNRSMKLLGSVRCVKPWTLPVSPDGTHNILEICHRPQSPPLQLNIGDQVSIFEE